MAKRRKYQDPQGPRNMRKLDDDEFMDGLFRKISEYEARKERGEIIDHDFETDLKDVTIEKAPADINAKLSKLIEEEIEAEKKEVPEHSILYELKGMKDSYVTKTNIELTDKRVEYIAKERAEKKKAQREKIKDESNSSANGSYIKYYLLAAAAVALIVSLYYFLSEKNEAVRNDPGKMLVKHFTLSRADSLKTAMLLKDLEKIASNGMNLSPENVRLISEKLRIFDPENAIRNFGVGENLAVK